MHAPQAQDARAELCSPACTLLARNSKPNHMVHYPTHSNEGATSCSKCTSCKPVADMTNAQKTLVLHCWHLKLELLPAFLHCRTVRKEAQAVGW